MRETFVCIVGMEKKLPLPAMVCMGASSVRGGGLPCTGRDLRVSRACLLYGSYGYVALVFCACLFAV